MRLHLASSALLLSVTACYQSFDFSEFEGSGDESSSSSSGQVSTTFISTVTTVATTPGGDESSTSDDTEGDTEGAPQGPQIADFELLPDPIFFNGPLTISVEAEGAEGVRLTLEDGMIVEMTEIAAEHEAPLLDKKNKKFEAVLPVMSGLENGEHTATLTPWRGEQEGEAVVASYTVALPLPGAESFWESGPLLGPGVVKAMTTLPSGEVVELGQVWQAGESRCYLRRRDPGGVWTQSDVFMLLPEISCAPVALAFREQEGKSLGGELLILAYRTDLEDQTRWWLGGMSSWGAPVSNVALGDKDELVTALAVHTSGAVAVCGGAPTGMPDLHDAAAWIYRRQSFSDSLTFDYTPADKIVPHQFTEIARDCAFAGDTLVLAGEAFGRHDGQMEPLRDRHFLLELDTTSKASKWTLSDLVGGLQSGARALVIDDQGRYLTAGYLCEDDCKPTAMLRLHDPKGGPAWSTVIGNLPSLSYGPHDLVWSPAGYAVVAVSGELGNEGAFWVRAYQPGWAAPLWTFSRQDEGFFHAAFALTIGTYGQVYAGGVGENGFPAVAYIGG